MAHHTTSIASRSHTRTWPESSSLVHTSSPRSRELTFTSTAFGADPEAVRCVAVADTPFAYKHLLYRSYCSGCTNKENEIIRSISISSEFTCANTRSKLGFPPHDWDNDFSRVHQCRRRGTHLSVRNAAHASIIRVVVIYVIEKLTGQLIDG
jgi:hypothetical protein